MFILLILSCGPNIKSFAAIKWKIWLFSCFSGRYEIIEAISTDPPKFFARYGITLKLVENV